MAETPKKSLQSPKTLKRSPRHLNQKPSPLIDLTLQTPPTQTPLRRSSRRASTDSTVYRRLGSDYDLSDLKSPRQSTEDLNGEVLEIQKSAKPLISKVPKTPRTRKGKLDEETQKAPKLGRSQKGSIEAEIKFSPVSPDLTEKKRKRGEERRVATRSTAAKCEKGEEKSKSKKRVYYKKVVYDGSEFEVGDDVYVKRREDASSDEEDPEIEECRVCFKGGKSLMIECDDCLGGFHLKCLKPPLKEVPEGDWICGFCEARYLGKQIELPTPPAGKKRVRTLREKLLSSDLWAARIERYDFFTLN